MLPLPSDLRVGQRVRLTVNAWIATERGLASREISGVVIDKGPRSLVLRGHAVLREAASCLRCGKEITHPVSRLVGYGPDCAEYLGIPRPDKLDVSQLEALRQQVAQATEVEVRLPFSQVGLHEVHDPDGSPVSAPPPSSAFPRAAIPRPFRPDPAAPPSPPPPPRIIDHNGTCFLLSYPDFLLNPVVKRRLAGVWHGPTKVWQVPTELLDAVHDFAETYSFTLTEAARAILEGDGDSIVASTARDADLQVEGLGGTLLPFQRAGVAYLAGKRRAICGDQMGLGKTVEALATLQYTQSYPAVVVCPASLKLNWEREARKWLPGKRVLVLGPDKAPPRKAPDVTIINYDILHKHGAQLSAYQPQALIVDESHYIKNPATKRSKAVHRLSTQVQARHGEQALVLLLTGTAILNRPDELLSQLACINRLDDFGGAKAFRLRYGRGFNLQDLNRKLRSYGYLRREKADVLTELPPKRRSVVPMELSNRGEYARAETDFITWLREHKAREAAFLASIAGLSGEARKAAIRTYQDDVEAKARAAETLVRINGLKQLAARGKRAAIIRWVEDFLADGEEKLVLFGWHHEMVDFLASYFKAPAISGTTPLPIRQQIVDRFQTDPDCRLVVLNMQAGGVGLTLTAASHVAFTELGWTPALHDQAEDRCHRIGQHDTVNAYYLLGGGTIEEKIAALLDSKRELVTVALVGGEQGEEQSILAELLAKLGQEEELAA